MLLICLVFLFKSSVKFFLNTLPCMSPCRSDYIFTNDGVEDSGSHQSFLFDLLDFHYRYNGDEY